MRHLVRVRVRISLTLTLTLTLTLSRSLWDAIRHSPYIASRLGLYTQGGHQKLEVRRTPEPEP